MREVIGCLVLAFLAGCAAAEDPTDNSGMNAEAAAPEPPAPLSTLELAAKGAFDSSAQAQARSAKILADTKKVMGQFLFDPFSAHYQRLRYGANGGICGAYNAKNRLGAYTGFKDFVIPADRSAVYTSTSEYDPWIDVTSTYASAYFAYCATKAELQRYRALLTPAQPVEQEPDDNQLMGEI